MGFEINKPLVVLHCDDDPFEIERVQQSLSVNALDVTFRVESFTDSEALLKRLKKQTLLPDVVMLDIDLGNEAPKGTELAAATRLAFPHSVIVMCSAMDDAKTIQQSLRLGADDFISKKSNQAELGLRIINSFQLAQLKRGTPAASDRVIPGLAGRTMQAVGKRVPRILSSAITAVHISGESGTGKEVVADIFAANLTPSSPFVKVNCGAITPSLLESELFGHVKGAFTGATSDKRGLIESANGGWIFLDEVATLSSSAQVALLRAIENQEIMRVGDNHVRKVKIKFLSATNEGLEQLVIKEKFRKDLWQRLCETEIKLPPLRERPDEIEPLIKFFCKNMPGGPYDIDDAALEALCAAPWHLGNVRELRNCLRAMTELHVNKLLTALAIPSTVWDNLDYRPSEHQASIAQISPPPHNQIKLEWQADVNPTYDVLADKLLIELAKMHAQGQKISMRSLAKAVGMSRSTLSGRFKAILEKDQLALQELAHLIGITDVQSEDAR